MSQDFNAFMGDVTSVASLVDFPFFLGLMAILFVSGLGLRLIRMSYDLKEPPNQSGRPHYSPIIVPFYAPRRDPNHPRRD